MTRRKSRPLLPYEVASFRSSQGSGEDVSHSSFSVDESSQQQPWSSQSSIQTSQLSSDVKQSSLANDGLESEKVSGCSQPLQQSHDLDMIAKPTQTSTVIADSVHLTGASEKSNDLQKSFPPDRSSIQKIPMAQMDSAKTEIVDLMNPRSSWFSMDQKDNGDKLPVIQPTEALSVPRGEANGKAAMPLALKRTWSLVRLSMSLDGKAKVTTGSESSPSPPQSQPRLMAGAKPHLRVGLQRTQSAVEPVRRTLIEDLLSSSVHSRRPMKGRSRDARTWEFYCDSDARDALTIQAEREQSGSAAGAISLIRSRSSKVMAANSNKRNAHQPNHESTKRQKPDGQQLQKPRLACTLSSTARLQAIAGNGKKQAAKTKDKDPKSGSHTAIYQDYDGDSDKENWEPGTQTSRIPRPRPIITQHRNWMPRPVLQESLQIPSYSSSLDTLMNKKFVRDRQLNREESSGKENSSPEEDEEVANFMSGSSVPREVEELDCVQNLLSLSQAAWQ